MNDVEPIEKPPKYISIEDFQRLGFIQEINRRLLHPCGLALEIAKVDGKWVLNGVWDYREDPEGIVYDPNDISAAKISSVDALLMGHAEHRMNTLGYVIQQPL